MSNTNSMLEISSAIEQLRLQQSIEMRLLEEQLNVAYEDIQPGKMISRAIKEIKSKPEVRDLVINTGIAIAAGFLSKKAFVGFSKNPIRKTLGSAVMFAVTNAILKNPDAVKSVVLHMFRFVRERTVGQQD